MCQELGMSSPQTWPPESPGHPGLSGWSLLRMSTWGCVWTYSASGRCTPEVCWPWGTCSKSKTWSMTGAFLPNWSLLTDLIRHNCCMLGRTSHKAILAAIYYSTKCFTVRTSMRAWNKVGKNKKGHFCKGTKPLETQPSEWKYSCSG